MKLKGKPECRTLVLVAGDDYAIRVKLREANAKEDVVFSDGDRAVMILAADEAIAIEGNAVGNTCTFYLSTDVTETAAACASAWITYCVHIFWADGGRSTPICDAPLEIVRCHEDA